MDNLNADTKIAALNAEQRQGMDMRYGGLIIAVVLAAIAAIVVLRMGASEPAPTPQAVAQPAVKSVNIYVASQPIPIGTVITKEMVAAQPWPEHLMLAGFMKAGEESQPIEGMVSRGQFQQNEPMISSKLANPNDPSFLAGDLPKGMRVVSIPLTEVDSVSGFVFPGDQVDVIYTHEVERWTYPPASISIGGGDSEGEKSLSPTKEKDVYSETLLTNVKVLAVDQRASGSDAYDKNGKLIVPRTASVMVSQSDAQRIRLAQKTGTLSLALRSLADKESADPLLLTSIKEVTQATDGKETLLDPTANNSSGVKVVRGAPGSGKEIEKDAASAMRGAPGMSGAVPISLPQGSNIVNPGLIAIP
jgi:pilus assembly protein CpaB